MDDDYKKLAQLCVILETYTLKKELVLEKFVQSNAHIVNCRIPENNYFKLKKPDLIGQTPLHIALKRKELETFEKLLQLGADFTVKNDNGQTVIHQVIQRYLKGCDVWDWKRALELYFVDTLLSALLTSENVLNPSNNDGISHFHIACMLNHTKAVELFLNSGVSVDQAVNFNSPILPGYTPLHFAARYFCLETIKVLLRHGANVHLKDAKGMSVLHMLIDCNMILVDELCEDSTVFKYSGDDYYDWELLDIRRPNKDLKEIKIVDFENTVIVKKKFELNKEMIRLLIEWDTTKDNKVIDDTGLSYFHVACCLQDFSMIKLLLEKGANSERCMNMNSRVWPGYTALHFAAQFDANAVRFLLQNGANILAKDATGTTPLDLCVAKYNVRQISSIIGSQQNLREICFLDSKTKLLDFTRCMKKTSSFNSFVTDVNVNIAIPHDSILWPGYTLLHSMIILCQRDSPEDQQKIKKLLDLGADVTVRNARGWTPLHLAFYKNELSIVDLILEHHPDSVNPVDDNGFSHLHIACIREKNVKKFINGPDINSAVKTAFIVQAANNFKKRKFYPELHITADSTPLHLAVVNDHFNTKSVMELLENGADICSRDIDGFTPLHHAFMRQTNYIRDASLWEKIFSVSDLKNFVANCGMSHLHMAAFMKNAKAVERLLDLGADVNEMITYTLPKNVEDMSVECSNDGKCNRRIPYHPHDVVCFLRRFTGYTPLEFALDQFSDEVVSILLRRGADVLVRKPDGAVLLNKLIGRMSTFYKEYKKDEDMQKYIEEKTGLTMLHFACSTLVVNDIVKSLNRIDVNSCAHLDSPGWPGCTPLHVLVMKGKFSCFDGRKRVCQLIELLIAKGANVTLQNAARNTPLHEVIDQSSLYESLLENPRCLDLDLAILILKNYKKYATNPVDANGLSHFHIACLCNDAASVKGFLEHGVDVNHAIDYFVESIGGYTPLHLAAARKSRETTILLLQYHADVIAKNVLDETPLQTIVFRRGIEKEDLDPFIKAGSRIDDKDLFDETPLESLIREYENKKFSFVDSIEIMKNVTNYHCRVNVFYSREQLGFMGGDFRHVNKIRRGSANHPFVQAVIDAPELNDVDFLGRSVIHNIVSAGVLHGTSGLCEEYLEAIEQFAKAGFDIDHQDNRGYTPLHLAAHFKHGSGITALLMSGADWNLIDKQGKPAYAYLGTNFEYDDCEYSYIHEVLYRHFKNLQFFKLHISSANEYLISQEPDYFEEYYNADHEKESDFLSDLLNAASTLIEPYTIRLSHFLSETGAVSAYAFKNLVERQAIDNFFHNNHTYLRKKFPELVGILYLQYRKAVTRKDLIEPANASLCVLSGFDLPHLCSEAVLKFLSNDELKNVIASTNDE